MKRSELLLASFSDEKNQESLIQEIQAEDSKFIKRSIQNLENELEDLETDLKKRLRAQTPIDSNTVENLYGGIKKKQLQLETYKSFKEKFLS